MSMSTQPPSGRKYRSKKERPCDLCRSRKIQCKIPGNEPVCETCKKLGRPCTFVRAPLRRKQPVSRLASDSNVHRHRLQARTPSPQENAGSTEVDCGYGYSDMMNVDVDYSRLNPAWLWPGCQESSLATAVPMGYDVSSSRYTAGSMPAPHFQEVESPLVGGHGDQLGCPDAGQPERDSSESSPGRSSMSSTDGTNPVVMERGCETRECTDKWASGYSLEARKGFSNELIGLSSESDPYLLRHYHYHDSDTYKMFRLDFRKVVDDDTTKSLSKPAMPVQFVMINEDIYKDGVDAVERIFSGTSSTESEDLTLLNKLISADLGSRLLQLYSRFVHPHLPVLSLADLRQLQDARSTLTGPVGLPSAVYALAASFAFLDDELSLSRAYLQVPTEDLWAIAHRSFQRASRLSHISSLQLGLLLAHMPPSHWAVADPPSSWALSCSCVALAESVGLNMEPSGWRLPRGEIMLRRRLWWLTYTQHVWQALVMGRASHINPTNWDVSTLTAADFEGDAASSPSSSSPSSSHMYPEFDTKIRESIRANIPLCLAQCHLSVIAADMLQEFYTLKAVRESPSLEALLRRAQPLRTRITSWRQSLPLLSKPASELTEDELNQSAVLRLSHLTVEILIYRALLRPLAPPTEPCVEPISTILENSYTCAKVGTELVSALKAKNFATFWPSYTRNQLCYISTFILLNLVQSPTRDIAVRNRILLDRWRDILRTQSQAWPVARLATIRLDAVFWKGLSVTFQGMDVDSPCRVAVE